MSLDSPSVKWSLVLDHALRFFVQNGIGRAEPAPIQRRQEKAETTTVIVTQAAAAAQPRVASPPTGVRLYVLRGE